MYIAEIGWNFMGDMSLAENMISAAASSGATHVKFQYWREEKLKKGEWDSDGRRDIYKSAQLNEDKIKKIILLGEKYKIPSFFSVFNKSDAELIKNLDQNIIKIPSHEIYNTELINFCISNFSKILISTGACLESELLNIADTINTSGKDITILHCVSCYPCLPENANLKRITKLKKLFPNAKLGLSDHTSSVAIPAVSAAYGSEVIEKHFTTNNNLPGRDNKFALLPKQFEEMVNFHKEALKGLIDHGINYQQCESDTVKNYRGRWG